MNSRLPPVPPPKPPRLQSRTVKERAPLPPDLLRLASIASPSLQTPSPTSFLRPPSSTNSVSSFSPTLGKLEDHNFVDQPMDVVDGNQCAVWNGLDRSFVIRAEPARVSLGNRQGDHENGRPGSQMEHSDLELDRDTLKKTHFVRQPLVSDLDKLEDCERKAEDNQERQAEEEEGEEQEEDHDELYLDAQEQMEGTEQQEEKFEEEKQSDQNHNGKEEGEDQVDNVIVDKIVKSDLETCNVDMRESISPVFYVEDSKLIEHLRMRNPELLPKLIKMHLSMLLDLNGECFANIFEENLLPPVEEGKRFGTIKKRKHESKVKDEKRKLDENCGKICSFIKLFFSFTHSHLSTDAHRRRHLPNVHFDRFHWIGDE